MDWKKTGRTNINWTKSRSTLTLSLRALLHTLIAAHDEAIVLVAVIAVARRLRAHQLARSHRGKRAVCVALPQHGTAHRTQVYSW